MKTRLTIILVALLTTAVCFGQKKNEVRVYGGFVGSDVFTLEPLEGNDSSDNENTFVFGIKYLRNITERLAVETGYSVFKTDTEIDPVNCGKPVNPVTPYFEKLKVIEIPLYANYTFGKYFFMNGGFLLSFDKSKGSRDSQSGIGYGIGVGAKYEVKNFVFYLNPNLKRCVAFIPFKRKRYHEKLTQLGVEFGVGYRF